LFQELLNEYQKYAEKVGIWETAIDESARKQLTQNQMIGAAKRFWPLLLLVSLAVLGTVLLSIRSFIKRRQSWKMAAQEN
jgi:hypothetical protein